LVPTTNVPVLPVWIVKSVDEVVLYKSPENPEVPLDPDVPELPLVPELPSEPDVPLDPDEPLEPEEPTDDINDQ
jgi:hypothetical protein